MSKIKMNFTSFENEEFNITIIFVPKYQVEKSRGPCLVDQAIFLSAYFQHRF